MRKSNGSPAIPPRRSNHFFKIYLPNLSSTHLRIPPAFHPHVEGEAPARFHLKGPSDYVWGVDLVKKSDGLFFADGWEEFVFDHSLAAGDFLLFKYNGSSTFSVMIFDNTACEKEGAFFARPTCDEKVGLSVDGSVKEEEKEEKVIAVINQSVKRKRTLADTNRGEVVMPRTLSMQRQTAQGMISGRQVSLSIASTVSELSRSSSCPFNKAFECSSDANLKPSTKQNKDGSQKKPRGFVSQRRPISQKEKDDALAMAKSFKSDKPFLMMVMKGSYVYHGFYLSLPGPFPFKHLPDSTGELFLHDPNKRQWSVNYIFSKRPALSGGWAKFSVANNLEMDDVCIFELIEKTHIKVHIFRVLDDIKPLLRISYAKENLNALMDSQ